MARWPDHRYNTSVSVVTVNRNVQGGLPCFSGTRVPVSSLFDHLKKGYSVQEFLLDFPTVTEEQVQDVLDLAKEDLPRHAESIDAE